MGDYDVEALMRGAPLLPDRQRLDAALTLRDLLRYGTLCQLVEAVLDRKIPDPWRSAALQLVPLQAVVVAVWDRLPWSSAGRVEVTNKTETYYNPDGTVRSIRILP